jgi:uncharacterized protein (TIRG00374 family)
MVRKSSAKPKTKKVRIRRRQLLLIGALVLVLYVVVPQLGAFRHSLELLASADARWVLLAGALYLATGLSSVGIYKILLPGKLPLLKTTIVEYGSSFANRLVPAGAGAVGVNFIYFRKQKCTPSEAAAAVTVNNLLGFIGHSLLVAGVLIALQSVRRQLHLEISPTNSLLLLAGIVMSAMIVWAALRFFRGRTLEFVRRTLKDLVAYRHQPLRVLGGLTFAMSITLLHSSCIWASSQALSVNVSVAQAIIVLAIGVGAGAIIPSPGGIGGAEAGLVAGLLAFNIPADQSVAVAILYRLASYWLGFLVGAVGFFISGRRGYV